MILFNACVPAGNLHTVHLKPAPEKSLPVIVQVPLNWNIEPQNSAEDTLSLYRKKTEEQISITIKKLATEIVTPEIVKTFSRIYLKEHYKDGWEEEPSKEDHAIDGNQALRYLIVKKSKANMIFFVEKNKYVYIITIISSPDNIRALEKDVIPAIRLTSAEGKSISPKKRNRKSKNKKPKANLLLLSSTNIGNIDIAKLNTSIEEFVSEFQKKKTLIENDLNRVEQYLFKLALFKAESYLSSSPVELNSIYKYLSSKTFDPHYKDLVKRCFALLAYLDNKPKEASSILQAILQKTPEDLLSVGYLCLLNPYNEQFNKQFLSPTYKNNKNNIFINYLQHKYLLNKGQKRKSHDLIFKLAGKHENNLWVKFCSARLLHKERQINKSVSEYRSILQTSPWFFPAQYNLALLLYKQKQYGESKDLLDKVLKRFPNDTEALLTKAMILKKLNKPHESKALLLQILAIDRYHYRALYNLGALCASKLNDDYCATVAFRQYLRIAPQNNRVESINSWIENKSSL